MNKQLKQNQPNAAPLSTFRIHDNSESVRGRSIREAERGESDVNYLIAGGIGAVVASALIVGGGFVGYMMSGAGGNTNTNDSVQSREASSENKKSSQVRSGTDGEEETSEVDKHQKKIINWLNNEASDILAVWKDRYGTAQNAARVSLSEPISKLKSTRRKWENLDHPNGLEKYHQWKTKEMNLIIAGMESFMAQEGKGEMDQIIGDFVSYAANKVLKNTLEKKCISPSKVSIPMKSIDKQRANSMLEPFEKMFGTEGMQNAMAIQGYDVESRLEIIDQAKQILGMKKKQKRVEGSDLNLKVDENMSNKELIQWYNKIAKPIISEFRDEQLSGRLPNQQVDLSHLKDLRDEWKNLEVPPSFRNAHNWIGKELNYVILKRDNCAGFRELYVDSKLTDVHLHLASLISNYVANKLLKKQLNELEISSWKIGYHDRNRDKSVDEMLEKITNVRKDIEDVKNQYSDALDDGNPFMKLVNKMIEDTTDARNILTE